MSPSSVFTQTQMQKFVGSMVDMQIESFNVHINTTYIQDYAVLTELDTYFMNFPKDKNKNVTPLCVYINTNAKVCGVYGRHANGNLQCSYQHNLYTRLCGPGLDTYFMNFPNNSGPMVIKLADGLAPRQQANNSLVPKKPRDTPCTDINDIGS